MRSKIIMAILLMTITIGTGVAGIASAQQPVIIMPTSGPNVDSISKTLLPPAGSDAASSIGLGVQYSSFIAGNPYSQFVTDSNGVIVPGTVSSGGLPTGNDFIPIHWTPSSADIGNKFTIHAEGRTTDGLRITIDTETAPAQPVPVEAGVLGGFMVTAGLVARKLNKKK